MLLPVTAPLADAALDQLFREARSVQRFLPREVSDATLAEVHALARLGPTGFNCQPARYLFIRSTDAKQRLAPAISSSNREKTLAAPVTVVIAWDTRFHEHLPALFPAYDAKGFFEKSPDWIEPTAKLNATLQAAYFFVAARAVGLDVGPMSGFKLDLVDREFFTDGRFRSLLVANVGYGDGSQPKPRLPRLSFEDTAQIL